MKQINLFVILLSFLSFQPASAQSVSIEWAAPNKNKSIGGVLLYGTDGGGYYGFSVKGVPAEYAADNMAFSFGIRGAIKRMDKPGGIQFVKVKLVRYDEFFKQTGKKIRIKSKDPVTGKKRQFMHLMLFNGKYLFISAAYNYKSHKNSIYAQFINIDGQFEGEEVEVDTEDVEKKELREYGFQLSDDKTKLLFFRQEKLKKRDKDANNFAFRLLDENLKSVWAKSFELEYENQYSVYKYFVDQNDKLYMAVKMGREKPAKDETKEEKEARRKSEKENKEIKILRKYDYRFVIHTYNGKSDESSKFEIMSEGGLKNKVVTDISFAVNKDEKIAITGFYSNMSTKINGCFMLKLDGITDKILLEKTQEFDDDFFEGVSIEPDDEGDDEDKDKEKEKDKSKNKGKESDKRKKLRITIDVLFGLQPGMKNFEIRRQILMNDGTVRIIAEQFNVWAVEYQSEHGGTKTAVYYIYGDILVISIGLKGQVEWASRIPKYQYTVGTGSDRSSFNMIESEGSLHFIYNDHRKNLDVGKTGRLRNMNGMPRKRYIPVFVSVDKEGKMKRAEIQQTDAEGVKPSKKNWLMVTDQFLKIENDYYVKQIAKRSYKFGKLTFSNTDKPPAKKGVKKGR